MIDFHIHCSASFDCEAEPQAQIDAAYRKGITTLCFTDHVDFDYPEGHPNAPEIADIAARQRILEAVDRRGITVLSGIELGILDAASAAESAAYLYSIMGKVPVDFIIGSVHQCDGHDCYYPEYYEGKTKAYAYSRYVEQLAKAVKCCDMYSVVGHYDFCAKFAPYADRAMRYTDAPDEFDELFAYVAQNGKGIEVNTAAWRDEAAWGLDIVIRYRQLGGEIITIGCDSHRPENVGKRLREAVEIIRRAGFKYITEFRGMVPNFIPIDEV